MKIGDRKISSELPPYIIAEISGNHVGKLENAIALIDAAKEAGADAVKLQCYTPDDMTIDCDKKDFILQDGPWRGRKLYELYAKAHTPREWFGELFAHARGIGIEIFSSVFSPEGVDFLEQFNPPCYKIASFEITDIPLIKYTASTGKPLIISTGMALLDEISDAWAAAEDADFAFLHCISGYPTPIEECDLRMASDYWNQWGGFCISDHTIGWEIPIVATALGAQIIEKHLMLQSYNVKDAIPEDFDFSMRPGEFATMVRKVKAIWQAMQPSERKSEVSSRQARRSLYIVKDMKFGERFTNENVRSIRPAYGMPPKELDSVLGCYAACDIERGTALEEGLIVPF